MSIKVKTAQFFYTDFEIANFNKQFGDIYGYGNVNLNFQNKLITGSITNPSGLYPAVFYKTGLLTGVITSNVGYFEWLDVSLSGSGQLGSVYLDKITGYKQATGLIEIDKFYKLKLAEGDSININNVNFSFTKNETNNLFEFSSIESLVNKLNSGSTGAYSTADGIILKNIVGVSGRIEYGPSFDKIYLTAIAQSGENGNKNRIYRYVQNIDTIKIPHRYFQGGMTFRPPLSTWTGNFNTNFNYLSAENSGYYNIPTSGAITSTIKSVAWENSFENNYYITTGIKSPNSEIQFSGNLMPFNSQLNKYTGKFTIPSASSLYSYTTFKFNILKKNPYNIRGNYAKYIISGNNFIFSDIIEG